MGGVKLFFITFVMVFSFATLIYAQNETNVTIECGNGICDFNETVSCPSDCDTCGLDEDCEDNSLCTFDTCEGTPKSCNNQQRLCDDGNPATIDECFEGECKYSFTTQCKGGDNYCPLGCSGIDSDCDKEDYCNSKQECDDGNSCTDDLCEGNPKSCVHQQKNGCISGDQCRSYGSREQINGISQYCNTDSNWKNQKEKSSLCDENYECLTNACSQRKCMEPAKEPSIFEKIIGWLMSLFGLIK